MMFFTRKLDAEFPHVYETWQTADATWVIQDLLPEDEEEALKVLVNNFCTDETLCSTRNLIDDPLSVQELCVVWRECFAQRMSLACYEIKDGGRVLAGLNVCIVGPKGEETDNNFKGGPWRDVYAALLLVEEKVDVYEHTGLDIILHSMGMVVRRDYRGAKLGKRLLNARRPLALAHGIKATDSVFTSAVSLHVAEQTGFKALAQVSMREMAAAGLEYPPNDDRVIKYMLKVFE